MSVQSRPEEGGDTKANRGHSPKAVSFGGLMADMAKWGVVFAPEGNEGSEGSDPPAGDPSADPKVDPKKVPEGPSEAEKALRAELATLKKQMLAFGGLTPETAAELKKAKEEADKLRADAAAAAKAKEEEELRKKGDFDALKARMAEEHSKELEGQKTHAEQLQELVNGLQARVTGMAMAASFAASRFIGEETLLSIAKAHKIYGEHFEVEEGAVVGYDAPRGTAKRTKIIDARGNPMPFDEAIKRIVEADPDRDTILRSRQKPGSGQGDRATRTPPAPSAEPRGVARIRLGIEKMRSGV